MPVQTVGRIDVQTSVTSVTGSSDDLLVSSDINKVFADVPGVECLKVDKSTK